MSFWGIFCPLTPLTTQNIKILKKWKISSEISSFYSSAPKILIICYTVPEIWRVTDVICIFHFGLFLPFYLPNSPKKQNLKKMKKNSWRYDHFTHVYQKLWLHDARFKRYGERRTDGWTDEQTENVTYRGGCST